MASHSSLFIIAEGTIRTYLRRDSSLELQRFEGDQSFSLGRGLAAFWDWWMRTNGYVAGEDSVDFILLAASEAPGGTANGAVAFFPESFVPVSVDESQWTLSQIESHTGSLYPGTRIRLLQADTAHDCPATPGQGSRSGPQKPLLFELTPLPSRNLLDGSAPASLAASPLVMHDEAPAPPLARGGAVSDHFREKTEMIRNKRR